MKRSTDITCVFATLAEAQPMLELLGAQIRTDTTFPSFRAPACGVSSTKALKPTRMKGRLAMSFAMSGTSNPMSNQLYDSRCSTT